MTADSFISYLDTIASLEVIQAYKRQSFALLQIRPGDAILDLGCGPGNDTLVLAGMAGSLGHVVGVDKSPDMVAEARKRAYGMGARPEYLVGDAYRLSFEDGHFDSCRTDRVLHSLEHPRQALSEMARVVHSGGHIVACEPDWEMVMIDSPFKALTRKILGVMCDTMPSGWVGRQLPRLFKECGLLNITSIPVAGTLDTFAQANELLHLEQTVNIAISAFIVDWVQGLGWLQLLKKADEAGTFFCGMTGLTVYGQKP